MVTDLFGLLLNDMGALLEIKDLHPDANNSCIVRFPSGVQIQLELDKSQEKLIFGCDIGEVPAGRYRANIFREALRSNGLPYPNSHRGIFAFSKKADHLILFRTVLMKDLNAEKLVEELKPFEEKAAYWQETVMQGGTPVVGHGSQVMQSGGMFGMRP